MPSWTLVWTTVILLFHLTALCRPYANLPQASRLSLRLLGVELCRLLQVHRSFRMYLLLGSNYRMLRQSLRPVLPWTNSCRTISML